jgi:hypothetical protein
MLTRLYLNSRQEVSHAAEYNSGGKTNRKITSGLRGILGIPGTKPSISPATTSTMGYGVCSFRATAAKTTTKSSSVRKTISAAWIISAFYMFDSPEKKPLDPGGLIL